MTQGSNLLVAALIFMAVLVGIGVGVYVFMKSSSAANANSAIDKAMARIPSIVQIRTVLSTRTGGPATSAAFKAVPAALPVEFNLQARYSDSAGSVISEENEKANEPLKDQVRSVVVCLEAAMASGAWQPLANDKVSPSRVAQYVQTVLKVQASAKALTTVNNQGLFTRMHVFHVPVLLACVRARASLDAETVSWLRDMHAAHVQVYKQRPNNQRLWLALSSMLLALVTKDGAMYSDAVGDWTLACEKYIQDDGTAPSELARGQRAGPYHEFLAQPMVYMAYIGELRHARLHALVNKVFGTYRSELPAVIPWVYLYNIMFGSQYISPGNLARFNADVAKVMGDSKTVSLGGYVYYFDPVRLQV